MDHTHTEAPRPMPMSARDWDERYAEHTDRRWGGQPNGVLVAEWTGRSPGRALEVGCGEGGDAIWLASRGWSVTAVDISQVAIDRAAAAAADAGVTVDWVRADIVATPPAAGTYDLVTTHYPALVRADHDRAIRALVAAVAPGGTLLLVGHAPTGHDHDHDPVGCIDPAAVAAQLDGTWTIEIDETRPRASAHPHAAHTHDIVLQARRRGGAPATDG